MSQAELFQWLANTQLAVFARDNQWAFPGFEIAHFIGLCTLFGAMLLLDLRVLGWVRGVAVANLLPLIPIAMIGFTLNLISGIAFFCSDPDNYWQNTAFRWKMALVLFGGANALAFELLERRKLSLLAADADAGLIAKVIAAMSLATWTAVIMLGRLLPYTGGGQG